MLVTSFFASREYSATGKMDLKVFFWPFNMTMFSRLDINTNTESVFAKLTLDKNKTLK